MRSFIMCFFCTVYWSLILITSGFSTSDFTKRPCHQSILNYSTITLTLDNYAHVKGELFRGIIENQPDLGNSDNITGLTCA